MVEHLRAAQRQHLYDWMAIEDEYVERKFNDERQGHDETLREHNLKAFWFRQIVQYLDRATLFLEAAREEEGHHTSDYSRRLEMRAQQALAKAFMTARDCVASSIAVYGPLPKPGVPSGTVEPWDD